MTPTYRHALIVGAGAGLSAAVARRFAQKGLTISLAARDPSHLAALAAEIGATAHPCDAGEPEDVTRLFRDLDAAAAGAPDVLVYNPSARVRGPLIELDPAAVAQALKVTAFGAFLAAQAAARRMLPNRHGAILLTGASAGVKGYPRSAPFAMGKFALRGLAQSMARELHPQGVHVGHFVIDGAIRNPGVREPAGAPDSMLDPEAIARTYLHFLEQDRSAWAWEIELRPWVEAF